MISERPIPFWVMKKSAIICAHLRPMKKCPVARLPLITTMDAGGSCPYVHIAHKYPDQFFDFALVDGRLRHLCIKVVIPKLRVGGMLILDNAERHVPCDAVGTYFERGHYTREPSEAWDELWSLKGWRTIRTANGLWITQIWLKP